MTTLAVIGDIHATFEHLDTVIGRIAGLEVDGVLLVGDLGSNDVSLAALRTPERDAAYRVSVERVLLRVRLLGVPVLWVPGNHDLPDIAGQGKIDGGLATIGELRIAGIGGAGPQRFGFCYEWDEDDVRARDVPECDLLLVHTPPANTPLDLVPARGEHVGSVAIRERALAHEGLMVCGHIHESPGAIQLGDCLCMNVGGLGAPFGKPQVGFVRRLNGADEAWHEDLVSGEIHRWRRL